MVYVYIDRPYVGQTQDRLQAQDVVVKAMQTSR